MFRSAADLRSRSPQRGRGYLLGILLALAAVVPPVSAQGGAGPTASFELTRGTQHALHRLQESWLQWVSSFYQDNPAKADEALRALDASARQVGMTRLVDFSLGAAALGLQSGAGRQVRPRPMGARGGGGARSGAPRDRVRARRPGRGAGRYLTAIRETASGFARLLSSTDRTVVRRPTSTFWLLAVLLVAAALFVLVEVATKGSAVVADLHRALLRRMAPASAVLCVGLALLWPLALPGGPLWLLLYWSALLWGYESPSERWATLARLAARRTRALARRGRAAACRRRALAADARPGESLRRAALRRPVRRPAGPARRAIGGDPAVLELVADVNRTLGQWDEARMIYRRVLELEPQNVPVLLNLGAYHFRKADFAVANEYFLRAANIVPPVAGAFYDLSLSYSETYQFEESRKALDPGQGDRRRARGPLGPDAEPRSGADVQRRRSRAATRSAGCSSTPGRTAATAGASTGARRAAGWVSLAGAGLAAALGLALYFVRRRKGFGQPSSWLAWRSDPFSRWLRALFPALSQAEFGEGGKVGIECPRLLACWRCCRCSSRSASSCRSAAGLAARLPWVLFVLGLLLYVGLCVRSELGERE